MNAADDGPIPVVCGDCQDTGWCGDEPCDCNGYGAIRGVDGKLRAVRDIEPGETFLTRF